VDSAPEKLDVSVRISHLDELVRRTRQMVADPTQVGFFGHVLDGNLHIQLNGVPPLTAGRVLALVEGFLRAGVMEEAKGWQPTECGTPQGGVISPLLANIYLNPLDQQMAQAGYEMVRYADDFVILCRSEAEAREALALRSIFTASKVSRPVPCRRSWTPCS